MGKWFLDSSNNLDSFDPFPNPQSVGHDSTFLSRFILQLPFCTHKVRAKPENTTPRAQTDLKLYTLTQLCQDVSSIPYRPLPHLCDSNSSVVLHRKFPYTPVSLQKFRLHHAQLPNQ